MHVLALVLQQTFASEGLQYSMGGLTGNTRNAHRLLSWAAAEHGTAKQNELAEQLFSGYHCKVLSTSGCAWGTAGGTRCRGERGGGVLMQAAIV